MVYLFAILLLLSIPLFIIGLIKPALFSRLKIETRKRASAAFGGLFLMSFVMVGILAPDVPTTESALIQPTTVPTEAIPPLSTPTPSPEPTQSLKKAPTNTPVPTKKLPTPTIKKNPTPTKIYIAPTSTSKPVQQSTTGGSGSNGYSGSLSGDKDCPDFGSHGEAQAYFNAKGGSASNNVDNLDADHDGIACESL